MKEINVWFILLIDSWNSSRLIIPFRWIGYVESNSTFKHPAKIKDQQENLDKTEKKKR